MSKQKPTKQPAKKKKIGHELIHPESDAGRAIYAMKDELVRDNHEDLREARIALAFNLNWKPDVDGRLQVGKCKLANDLDRELAEFDLVVILLREFWQDSEVTDRQRRALMDHELTHAALSLDSNGEPVEDEKGRKVYRIRKHDVEEFSGVVERHGLYKTDLAKFAKSVLKGKQRALFDEEAETEYNAGRPAVEDDETDGVISGRMNPDDDDDQADDAPRKYPLAVEERITARATSEN